MSRWPPRPRLAAEFYKAHGLGNDYLVFEEGEDWIATPENVRRVCHRTMGVGSDGIVVLLGDDPGQASGIQAGLRMFNPDGGEFERSGNGLRVLASYLPRASPEVREVDVEVGGGRVRMRGHGVIDGVYDVSVEMGRASIGPGSVAMDPGALDGDGCLLGPSGESLRVVPVSVGNPHVVVLCDEESDLSEERLAEIGPYIATHPALEHGTNVQLALADGGVLRRAALWERGVGRTSAAGAAACAVGVALVTSGLLSVGEVRVRMPGGVLGVKVTSELDVVLRGPVEEVMDGRISCALLQGEEGSLTS